jgi:ParB family chromosome partitioning protein
VSRERRLGRGLEALLGRAGVDAPAPVTDGSAAVASKPAARSASGLGSGAARLMLHAPEEVEQAAAALPTDELAIAAVDPNPWQPRTVLGDEDLAELADSLREHGLVQPIVVRATGDRYQLIAGQRRLAAARRLGWERVPARVLDVEDRQMAEIAIVENLQRRDLDALEKAASFKQYLATWGCTQEELAKRLSIDRSHVANLIRLLELPAAVQQKLRGGKLTMGHARALLPLGDEEEQVRLADRVARGFRYGRSRARFRKFSAVTKPTTRRLTDIRGHPPAIPPAAPPAAWPRPSGSPVGRRAVARARWQPSRPSSAGPWASRWSSTPTARAPAGS